MHASILTRVISALKSGITASPPLPNFFREESNIEKFIPFRRSVGMTELMVIAVGKYHDWYLYIDGATELCCKTCIEYLHISCIRGAEGSPIQGHSCNICRPPLNLFSAGS